MRKFSLDLQADLKRDPSIQISRPVVVIVALVAANEFPHS
jgi:hypothetical protein